MRKRVLLVLAVCALVAGVTVAVAAPFTDPPEDTFGPDITTVNADVSGGNLVVDVHFGNRTNGLEDAEIAEIDVDTDANGATGDDGIDIYSVYEGGQDNEVLRFDKDDYVDTTEAHATKDAQGVHLRIPLGLVGHQVKFTAQAIAAPPPDQDPNDPPPPPSPLPDTDNAPDTGDYTVTIARPTLKRATATFTPARPRAGKAFKLRGVSLFLSSGGPFAGEPTCIATLAGKKLGPARACAWRIPANARGKSLRVAVTATFAGTAFNVPTKTFVVR
jgi:hypothetical protein